MLDVGKSVGDFFRITEKRDYPVRSKLSPKVDSFLSGFSLLSVQNAQRSLPTKLGEESVSYQRVENGV